MPVNSHIVATLTEIFQFRNHSGWKIEIFSFTLVPIDAWLFLQSTNFHWNFSVLKPFWLKIEIFSVTLVPIDTCQFPQSTIFHWNISVSKQFWLKNWNFQFHFSSHWYPSIPTECQLSLKFSVCFLRGHSNNTWHFFGLF
jgi:hypothetical protein